ncbi:MAG: hypothetical protein KGO02_07645 [Alphaproteobacteria bacterium]|nr:hypothetical protein [Alphaproteobacteria bacterium]
MSDSNGDEKKSSDETKSSSDLMRNPLVLVGIAVVLIAAVVGAYFLGRSGTGSSGSGGGTQTAQNAPVGGVCGVTLERLKAYGVVEADTVLISKDATSTATKDRVACSAKSGAVTYKAEVDERCSNLSDFRCLRVWNVTDSNGKTLFQHRGFLPPSD